MSWCFSHTFPSRKDNQIQHGYSGMYMVVKTAATSNLPSRAEPPQCYYITDNKLASQNKYDLPTYTAYLRQTQDSRVYVVTNRAIQTQLQLQLLQVLRLMMLTLESKSVEVQAAQSDRWPPPALLKTDLCDMP